MNRPPRGAFAAEMLAYVDNCLPQEDRQALENRMIECPEVKSQIEQWLLQNEAIRAAFADQPPRPAPTAGGRFAAASFVEGRPPQGVKTKRESKESQRRPRAVDPTGERHRGIDAGAPATAQPASRAKRRRPAVARRVFCTIAGALALWVASATLFSRDPSIAFVEAGAAAYRTFAGARRARSKSRRPTTARWIDGSRRRSGAPRRSPIFPPPGWRCWAVASSPARFRRRSSCFTRTRDANASAWRSRR